MRGRNSVPQPAPSSNKLSIQERNSRRNAYLAARYYYYTYTKSPRLAYDAIIEIIATEMWLANATIINVLSSHHKAIKDHVAAQTTVEELRTLYPHIQWP